jgi:predicted glycogen debranching enzyme
MTSENGPCRVTDVPADPGDARRYSRFGPAAAEGTTPHPLETLARTEWLLTNGLGGFAMGTALGAPTRRYHGLLVASLRPPVQRVLTLGHLAETLILRPGTPGEQRADLSVFRFRPGELHPRGDQYLAEFRKDRSVHWIYRVRSGGTEHTLHKQVTMVRGRNAVGVRYVLSGPEASARLVIHPLVALRDFHSLILRETNREWFRTESSPTNPRTLLVQSPAGRLFLQADRAMFHREEQWWYNFQYDLERDRGYDYLEDLFRPGTFVADLIASPAGAELTLSAGADSDLPVDVPAEHAARGAREEGLIRAAAARGRVPKGDAFPRLVVAADDFVVRRVNPPRASEGPGAAEAPPDRVSIIAGYPWFADWGRDSMIATPGLLLATGRHDEARDVLRTFAGARSAGLIPNLFDDYTGRAAYNTVDASLWFIHACGEYLRATGDRAAFDDEFLPACRDIVAAYLHGTQFGIRADPADDLIAAGDPSTQLTWMDAKRDGIAFTPRHGKPVEVNALWYHALATLAELTATADPAWSADLAALRDRVGESFRRAFWNPHRDCCYDALTPEGGGWAPQGEVRPNQLLAVSLRHSPLTPAQQRAVVRVCTERLLTPHGLRTLEPGDARYRGRYRGRMFDRDAAYHNGTAWPWLLGPYAEALLRSEHFSDAARERARDAVRPLLAYLDADLPGQLPEVFDADDLPGDPQRAGGCPAQAWSVAEVLRVLLLIERGDAPPAAGAPAPAPGR